MATYYIGLNRGQTQNDGNVVVQTTVPSSDIYVFISTTNNPTKKDVKVALESIIHYILGNGVAGAGAGIDLPPI